MNNVRIPKKILNMIMKGKYPRSRWIQQIGKDVRRKEEYGTKLKRSFGKTRDGWRGLVVRQVT
jgi:hypothetical protein